MVREQSCRVQGASTGHLATSQAGRARKKGNAPGGRQQKIRLQRQGSSVTRGHYWGRASQGVHQVPHALELQNKWAPGPSWVPLVEFILWPLAFLRPVPELALRL